ncbi:MAG: class I SAM-dependent methyltransferase [Alphaproteobacteria bacterium]|nr:class I SAM-dependent methyltransferase [Alphaproteobacteria bacterium]
MAMQNGDKPSGDADSLLPNPGARRAEWFRYYSDKRIGQQWFQLHLLDGLEVQSVLEVGPNLGLVTALLANAGFIVTTLDMLPSQDPRADVPHIQGELTAIDSDRLSGHDAILCCETLEHLPWERVQDVLAKFHAARPKYLVISVPYMGFQIDWRLYLNRVKFRSKFSFKKLNFLRRYQIDQADPWGHKWEVGYRGHSLAALEEKIGMAGWRINRRDFTSPTRSVFHLLSPK